MSSFHAFLTRPQGRNGTVPQRLRALGMAVSELPALTLRPAVPPHVPPPGAYDVVVFVSRYAVQRYFTLLGETGHGGLSWPRGTVAATVGASSAHALSDAGVPASCVVHPPVDTPAQDSEALLDILQQRGANLERVLVVRGTQGREWLGRSLTELGAQVEFLPVYERAPAAWSTAVQTDLATALRQPDRCIFLLTSGEGVHAMAAQLDARGLLGPWSESVFVVIHERIGATLQSVLVSHPGDGARRLTQCMPDDDSIVEAIHAVAGPTAKP